MCLHDQNYHALIKTAIEIYKKQLLDIQRADLYAYAVNNAKKHPIDPLQFNELKTIFAVNRIDPRKFASNLKFILDKTDPKINTLRLIGVPNSCKTLIANCIIDPFVACRGNNHGSENEFYLSGYLCVSVVKIDELYITIATCEDMKSILGGEPIDIAKKFNDKQLMCRTPFFLTNNQRRLGRGHLPAGDEAALDLRCIIFNMPTTYRPTVRINSVQFYLFIDYHLNK